MLQLIRRLRRARCRRPFLVQNAVQRRRARIAGDIGVRACGKQLHGDVVLSVDAGHEQWTRVVTTTHLIHVGTTRDKRLHGRCMPFAHGQQQRGESALCTKQFGVARRIVVQPGATLGGQSSFLRRRCRSGAGHRGGVSAFPFHLARSLHGRLHLPGVGAPVGVFRHPLFIAKLRQDCVPLPSCLSILRRARHRVHCFRDSAGRGAMREENAYGVSPPACCRKHQRRLSPQRLDGIHVRAGLEQQRYDCGITRHRREMHHRHTVTRECAHVGLGA